MSGRLATFVREVSEQQATGGDPNVECPLCRGELQREAAALLAVPALAPWYLADGSSVMLPAEVVERRRKTAAVALKAAEQAWIRQDRDSMIALGEAVALAARAGCYAVSDPAAPPTTPAPCCKTCGDTGWIATHDTIEPGIFAPAAEPCQDCDGPDAPAPPTTPAPGEREQNCTCVAPNPACPNCNGTGVVS